jgi:N-acyl-L-homoserine lactone synthetase
MVIVESGVSGLLDRRILRQMFEARKQVFVDLLKWNVPILEGRFEVDQFDDEQAIYIIVADPAGEHLGSTRLLRTTRPHILGTLFPELCSGPVPAGEDVFEITRFCLGRNQGAARRRHTRNRLVSALVRFALANGIKTYTGVAEMAWLQQILAFGWDCRPLGAPRHLGSALTGALAISITPETPSLLERSGIWAGEKSAGAALAEAA